MTTFISTGPSYVSTAAQIQALATVVAQAFNAMGLVKTSDTGQMNTTTITFPASSGSAAGYEIRRFDDPLQASYPIYIRWEPYRTNATTNGPAIRFRFGTGTDGAGNLTNEWVATNYNQGTFVSIDGFPGIAGGTRPIWATGVQSAAEARASLIYAPDPTSDFASVGLHMAVQRTVDNNGVPTGDGFFAFVGSYNPLLGSGSYDIGDENYFGFAAPAGWRGSWSTLNVGYTNGNQPGIIGVVPLAGIGVFNGIHYPTPWTALGRSRMYPPLPDWLLYHKQVLPIAGTNFTVKRNGVNRTFRATGQSVRTGTTVQRGTTSAANQPNFDWRLAVIWE